MRRIGILLCVFLLACNSNVRQGNEGSYYQYEPLNWEILIPDGWEVMSESELDKMTYKAKGFYQEDEFAKQYGEKKIVMGLRKPDDKITAMYAFVRDYRTGDDPPRLKDVLNQQYQSYSSDFYSADTALTKENIEGKEFEKAVLEVSYNSKPYFTYVTYSTMLGDTLNFGASLIIKNQADRSTLERNFRLSVAKLQ